MLGGIYHDTDGWRTLEYFQRAESQAEFVVGRRVHGENLPSEDHLVIFRAAVAAHSFQTAKGASIRVAVGQVMLNDDLRKRGRNGCYCEADKKARATSWEHA